MRGSALAGLLIVAVLAGAGMGYFAGSSNGKTVTSVAVSNSTVTNAFTSTIYGKPTTLTTTFTSTSIQSTTLVITTTLLTTTTTTPGVPWNNSVYLTDAPGCSVNTAPAPCFNGNISEAVVFDCTTQAAMSQGCSQTVTIAGTTSTFVVNVWFPHYNQTSPWSNCDYIDSSDGSYHFPAYCLSVTSAAFLILIEAPTII